MGAVGPEGGVALRTEEEAAFVAFVQGRTGALLRTAHLLTGDLHRGEDLLQTAFERLAKRWSRLDGDPEAYLRRVMVNLATDRWRLAGRRVREVELGAGVETPAGQDATVLAEARQDLVRALARLTARQRAVLVLRYFDDLPEKDVAAAGPCSCST